MKSKEELDALKEEIKTLSKKLSTLTDEELKLVTGGLKVAPNEETSLFRNIIDWLNNIAN